LTKCLLTKCLLTKCLLTKCLLTKCLLTKCLLTKCLLTTCLSNKCLWPNVCWPHVCQTNVYDQMSVAHMSGGQMHFNKFLMSCSQMSVDHLSVGQMSVDQCLSATWRSTKRHRANTSCQSAKCFRPKFAEPIEHILKCLEAKLEIKNELGREELFFDPNFFFSKSKNWLNLIEKSSKDAFSCATKRVRFRFLIFDWKQLCIINQTHFVWSV